MVQSLELSGAPKHIRRVNRLPLLVVGAMLVVFVIIIVVGLASRGIGRRADTGQDMGSDGSASTYAENLKRGVSDGIIGEPLQPAGDTALKAPSTSVATEDRAEVEQTSAPRTVRDLGREDTEDAWLSRLERERAEQLVRERHRQEMARLQARNAALDSPMTVEVADRFEANGNQTDAGTGRAPPPRNPAELYAQLQAGVVPDPNLQSSKDAFFNADIKELGYLPNGVVPARSPFELKRGTVIPATLISGINSDLPGRISAQVNHPIYDSATGRHLLVPQGAKLFGRYDAEVSFGQSRVLVIWTDLIFPDGSTLQLGGMAGTDAEGYGGFTDKVDRHLLKTFGSAALVALFGAGMDMSLPSEPRERDRSSASDAARRSFAETFGRVAERTITKNLDVQPTLRIRPGYIFNVLVDQDIIFPRAYR